MTEQFPSVWCTCVETAIRNDHNHYLAGACVAASGCNLRPRPAPAKFKVFQSLLNGYVRRDGYAAMRQAYYIWRKEWLVSN